MNDETGKCMQAVNLCEPPRACYGGPYGHALCELEIVRDNSYRNHDIAIHEGRYDDAKRYNDRVKSMAKAIHLLTAADKVHTEV